MKRIIRKDRWQFILQPKHAGFLAVKIMKFKTLEDGQSVYDALVRFFANKVQ